MNLAVYKSASRPAGYPTSQTYRPTTRSKVKLEEYADGVTHTRDSVRKRAVDNRLQAPKPEDTELEVHKADAPSSCDAGTGCATSSSKADITDLPKKIKRTRDGQQGPAGQVTASRHG